MQASLVTPEEVKHWIVRGEKMPRYCIYHQGYLVKDRARNESLHEVASILLGLAQSERVHLFQKKLGEDYYNYFVITSP